ncbi:CGNR zinc finger domain-containing protein [Streptomyces sp. MB09-02B]|uniref:CGNR zinc finger domain-containing protein n=1 Tax=Streptomyces sp. MB09-02B TaxID=3028667 RepID=UPI0029A3D92F|nr:CGNR zinc finger domain-containing protein [Streptomyces sp. MB09-02B]MDX3639807.1 CGNR zinc finger domain-containing protein [Streptomyces sp. MB09-02B]
MECSISGDARLALDLALTVRHDGSGGVADDLTDVMGLATWVRAHADDLPATVRPTVDETTLTSVRDLRGAVRALFAHAVAPAEPSPADASRLLPVPEALARLNETAALSPTVPVLTWGPGADPVLHHRPATGEDPLAAALARAALAFLASPERQRLRACHAPRCVRYFLKEHPRQEWCKPSCGNRARVARHHDRHRKTSA